MDFDALESVEAQSWEARHALRNALKTSTAEVGGDGGGGQAGSQAATRFRPPRRHPDQLSKGPKIEVTAKHALLGVEMNVVLPERAKFKHVRRALAKRFENEDFETKARIIQKVKGIYSPYKDDGYIKADRHVLIFCPGLETLLADGAEAALSDDDLSTDQPGEEEAGPPSSASGSASAAAGEEPAGDSDGEAAAGAAGSSSAASKARASWLATRISPGSSRGVGPVKMSSKGPCMTKRQVLSLQTDLHAGFSDVDFQAELRALLSDRATFASHAEFVKAKQDLLLQVQRKVLPEYGFEGSMTGVIQMMAAMGPFGKDPDIVKLGSEINELIAVDIRPEAWRDVSRQCRDLRADVAAKQAAEKEARKRRENLATERRKREERRASGKVTSLPAPAPIPKSWLDDKLEPGSAAFVAAASGTPSASSTGVVQFLNALPFSRWPSPFPPVVLAIAGSWNGHKPETMTWMAGLFMFPVTVGPRGSEDFQLLLGGRRDAVLYPSMVDANHLDEGEVLGPDDADRGRCWLIGKGYPRAEDEASPGARFAVVAAMDSGAVIRLVGWQKF